MSKIPILEKLRFSRKRVKGPYLEKPEMASYLARCPNPVLTVKDGCHFLPFNDF